MNRAFRLASHCAPSRSTLALQASQSHALDASRGCSHGTMLDSALRVVLGTMTFAGQTSQRDAATMLRTFLGAGHVEIDTARMYMSGETESCLGAIFDEEPALRRLKTSTKANAFQGYDKSLDAASVAAQFRSSRAALRGAPVQIYYLHNPDGATPILETLEAVDALHRAGAFEELGLSNFAAWEVAHIYHLCAAKGFVKPSVYQGMYNALTRRVETELFPCLRHYGIPFYASPGCASGGPDSGSGVLSY